MKKNVIPQPKFLPLDSVTILNPRRKTDNAWEQGKVMSAHYYLNYKHNGSLQGYWKYQVLLKRKSAIKKELNRQRGGKSIWLILDEKNIIDGPII